MKIATTLNISVPKGTKIISNGEWITLARKNEKGNVEVFTCIAEDIASHDLNEESAWLILSKEELKKLSSL